VFHATSSSFGGSVRHFVIASAGLYLSVCRRNLMSTSGMSLEMQSVIFSFTPSLIKFERLTSLSANQLTTEKEVCHLCQN